MSKCPKILILLYYDELLFKEETREDVKNKGGGQKQEIFEGGTRQKGSRRSLMDYSYRV